MDESEINQLFMQQKNPTQVNKILLVSVSMINTLDGTENDETIFQYTRVSSFRK